MTTLIHNTLIAFKTGMKNVDMEMTSGDARLQISVNGSAYKDIVNTIKTASANFNITVGACSIKALITGDAVVEVSVVRLTTYGSS